MSVSSAIFHPKLRAFQIWGTHQGVGKTTVSVILSLAIVRKKGAKGVPYHITYSKPISIGPQHENSIFENHFRLLRQEKTLPNWYAAKAFSHQDAATSNLARSNGTWKDQRQVIAGDKNKPANDAMLLQEMTAYSASRAANPARLKSMEPPGTWLFFETLAGVNARMPSQLPQADVYKPLKLPGLLVGNSDPGGLDKTIQAYEYLRSRGYDIQGAFVFKDPAENYLKIVEYFDKYNVHCAVLRQLPERHPNEHKARRVMLDYLKSMGRSNSVQDLQRFLQLRHKARVDARLKGEETPEEVALAALAKGPPLEIEESPILEHQSLSMQYGDGEGTPARPRDGHEKRNTPPHREQTARRSGDRDDHGDRTTFQSRESTKRTGGGGYGGPPSSAVRTGSRGYGDPATPRPREPAARTGGGSYGGPRSSAAKTGSSNYGNRATSQPQNPAAKTGSRSYGRPPSSAARTGGSPFEDRTTSQPRKPARRTGGGSHDRASF